MSATSNRSTRVGSLPDSGQEMWIFTTRALRAVLTPAVRDRLARGTVFEIVAERSRPVAELEATLTQVFASAQVLTDDIAADRLLPGVRAVLYDPEQWTFTPVSEQVDPVAATAEASAAARRRGLLLIVAPAMNLARAMRPAETAPVRETYLRLGLPAKLAPYADVLNIQAQSLIRDAQVYGSFVRSAAAQVRHANRTVTVLSGLSTNPPGAALAPGTVSAAMRASGSMVSGWWMNIPSPGPKCPRCSATRPDHAVAALEDPRTEADPTI